MQPKSHIKVSCIRQRAWCIEACYYYLPTMDFWHVINKLFIHLPISPTLSSVYLRQQYSVRNTSHNLLWRQSRHTGNTYSLLECNSSNELNQDQKQVLNQMIWHPSNLVILQPVISRTYLTWMHLVWMSSQILCVCYGYGWFLCS